MCSNSSCHYAELFLSSLALVKTIISLIVPTHWWMPGWVGLGGWYNTKTVYPWNIHRSQHYRSTWRRSTPFPSFFLLVLSLPRHLLFFTFSLFPFLIRFTYFLLLSIPSLSTRIVLLHFQAEGHRRRPNLGLVSCVYFVLSVSLS